eukprot:jgi/Bigna1/75155/fgenesh1_pg.33_\
MASRQEVLGWRRGRAPLIALSVFFLSFTSLLSGYENLHMPRLGKKFRRQSIKNALRRGRKTEAQNRRNRAYVKAIREDPNQPDIPVSISMVITSSGKWQKRYKMADLKMKPKNLLEWEEKRRREKDGEFYGIDTDSTDEETQQRRAVEYKDRIQSDRPFAILEGVAIKNLNASMDWNGMKGTVIGYKDNNNKVIVQVLHGRTKKIRTVMALPFDKVESIHCVDDAESTRIRKLKRLEKRFSRLSTLQKRVGEAMKKQYKRRSPDNTFHPTWLRNIIDFVRGKTASQLRFLLWKKTKFRYFIPYPSGVPPPLSVLTNIPSARNTTKKERLDCVLNILYLTDAILLPFLFSSTRYYPSNEELGLPEWEVGDDVKVDVEMRGYFRKGKVADIEHDSEDVPFLIINYYDPEEKRVSNQNKTFRIVADEWSRLQMPKSGMSVKIFTPSSSLANNGEGYMEKVSKKQRMQYEKYLKSTDDSMDFDEIRRNALRQRATANGADDEDLTVSDLPEDDDVDMANEEDEEEEERGENSNADGDDDILLQSLHNSSPYSSSWYKRLKLREDDDGKPRNGGGGDDDDDEEDDATGGSSRKKERRDMESIHEAAHLEDDIGSIDPDNLADGTTVSSDKLADT